MNSASSRLLHVFTLALLLVGPTICVQKPLQAAPMHIGVVSILGDDFQLIRVGMTLWERENHTAIVLSWNIDDYVTDLLNQQLGKSVDLSVTVMQSAEVTLPGSNNQNFSFNRMFEAANTHGFDAVIVVRPAKEVKAAHLEGGYGLLHHNLGGSLIPGGPTSVWSGPERRVFSVFLVELVDTRKLNVVGSIFVQSVSDKLDVTYKPSLDEFSPDELEIMERNLKAMLRAEIAMALRKLNNSELSAPNKPREILPLVYRSGINE